MLSNIFLFAAAIFLLSGAIGINRLRGLYPKLLTSSLIDTMAFIMLIIGLILRVGINGLAVRLVIVLIFVLLTNPVINHIITQAAHEADDKE